MTKAEVFLNLAKPNEDGCSRWITRKELEDNGIGFGNGGDFIRANSTLDKKYIILKDKTITPGNKIDAVKLNGLKEKENNFSQYIPKYIYDAISKAKCSVLGTSNPEVDHKDGRKINSNNLTINDFQPLSKAANDAKRQFCKECKKSNKRFDAKNLGYKKSFTEGSKNYEGSCIGCYWYDVKDFNSKV